jgi:hypothetical protein
VLHRDGSVVRVGDATAAGLDLTAQLQEAVPVAPLVVRTLRLVGGIRTSTQRIKRGVFAHRVFS